ncbi:hypothetical protein L6164_005698 [Bauhinia variegata]|uniref:Uncharacterized protein n=1 Tax=Bauhinia variegata TaxID=167791 RepID=A0ACB9PS36_BAUVA|nr:hypothetical protein L6164_005698 [Bauhinia variegata]
MSETPVLSLPNFNEEFILETDASGQGMGAVLIQRGHPICYFSKKFCPTLAASSTYVRELHAITEAFLHWAEWHYNIAIHSSTGMSPFQVMFGQTPPSIPQYISGTSNLEAVDQELQTREAIFEQLQKKLHKAQVAMKEVADQKRRPHSFQVGDLVFVKLRPYRQSSIKAHSVQKLAQKYYGPFQISSCINEVAFELTLPPTAKIHPVFHVSKFKPCKGITLSLPPLSKDNQPLIEPTVILDTRNAEDPENTMVLVQWLGLYPEDSTWESLSQLKNDYPNFHLEDKVVLDRGRDAMNQQEGWDEGPSSDAEEEPEITIPQVRAKRNKVKPKWMKDYNIN